MYYQIRDWFDNKTREWDYEWIMSNRYSNDLLSTSLSRWEHQWNWCDCNTWFVTNEKWVINHGLQDTML